MTLNIQPAHKTLQHARVLITGVDGSGKSLGGLYLAKGLLGGNQALVVIDTEGGKINQYSEIMPFHTLTLHPPHSPESFITAIKLAIGMCAGGVLMVDNISREWVWVEEEKDKYVFDNPECNQWAARTPFISRHYAFLQTLLNVPCHVIATATSKTEVVVNEKKSIKVGGESILKKETGVEFNPEFQCIAGSNHFTVKSSAGAFDDDSTFHPTNWHGEGDVLNEGHGRLIKGHLHANTNGVMSREMMQGVLSAKFTSAERKMIWDNWKDAPMADNPSQLEDELYAKFYDYCMKGEVKKDGK